MCIDLTSSELEKYALSRLSSSPLRLNNSTENVVKIIEKQFNNAIDDFNQGAITNAFNESIPIPTIHNIESNEIKGIEISSVFIDECESIHNIELTITDTVNINATIRS